MASSGIEARRQAAMEEGSAAYIARRQEIVRAAAHVFRDKGYEATLKDVAQALGTERASIYYYFGSKEELLQEIVREALARDMEAAHAIRRSKDSTPDKIRALIHSMVISYAENYPHMNVYIEDLGRIARQDSEWAVDVIEETRQYEALVRSILRQGQEEGALREDIPINVASMALFGTVNWMYRWYRPTYPVPPEEIANGFAAIFLEGFGVPGAQAPPAE
jgi:AcrR family transcriptional regulator